MNKPTIADLEKALDSQPGECIARINPDGTILLVTEQDYLDLQAKLAVVGKERNDYMEKNMGLRGSLQLEQEKLAACEARMRELEG